MFPGLAKVDGPPLWPYESVVAGRLSPSSCAAHPEMAWFACWRINAVTFRVHLAVTVELVIHIPVAQTARMLPWLAEAAQGRAEILRDSPAPVLALDSLRCLNITLFGSGEHVRAPVILPFLRMDGFNFAHAEAPRGLMDADWLVVGGNGQDLARLAAQTLDACLEAGRKPVLRMAPFARLGGALPQGENLEGPRIVLNKSWKNFNQAAWVKTMRRLMDLPEERWAEAGISNTMDQLHVFEDALDRLVPGPPKLVLDLGCGLGQTTRSLALRYPGARVVGVDSSAEAIAVARQAFRLKNLSYAVMDLSAPLGFPRGGVDLIVSTNALPYARNQQGTARELFALLSADGLLLNHCRTEESHLFWDFPWSLLLPTSTQIFLADWYLAAREAGLGTAIWQAPLNFASAFYKACAFAPFAEGLDAYAEARRLDGPGEYAPSASHVLLAHGRHVREASPPALSHVHNHLARLDMCLASVVQRPREIQRLAITAWLANVHSLDLFPEAMELLALLLPGVEPLLRTALAQGSWRA